MKYQVVVFQYRMLQYREALFKKLRAACADKDIELVVVYGQPTTSEATRNDNFGLDWGRKVRNRWMRIGGKDIVWQPFPADLRKTAHLVIVMQENRLLRNYPLQLARGAQRPKVAFWGHGRDYQTTAPYGWRERWKKFWLTRVDWWFAYTEMSRRDVEDAGYDRARVTVLNNSIDGAGFERDLQSISEAEVLEFKASLGTTADAPIVIHCGSLHADKRIDFMVAASDELSQRLPGFRFIVIGAGPEGKKLEAAARTRPWMHLLGVKKGREKALAFKASTLMLNPGLVGLHVVDSFVAGCPLVTLATSRHSPEIEYLEDGENAIVVKTDSVSDYATQVGRLLTDPSRLDRMEANCLAAAKRYTLDAMVENFSSGILAALRAPHRN
jgi:glycosyltransferase involved in cell wall biosynthesis